MFRLFSAAFLCLLSLLTIVTAPTNFLWYAAILVTEFCWVFFISVLLLLLLPSKKRWQHISGTFLGVTALILFSQPVFSAWKLSSHLTKELFTNVRQNENDRPFRFTRMFSLPPKNAGYKTYLYEQKAQLMLDYYRAPAATKSPCVVVIHGGSWAVGDSRQLPELNSVLAKMGYNIAAINYRLAPKFEYPAPVQDISAALRWLKTNCRKLNIDTSKIVLLGRSAGAQIALSAAYTLNDPGIKGVIGFYGPTDMVWGWANPTSPLVMDSRKIMANYLGGDYRLVPKQYNISSPTETVSRGAPATLLLYGQNDPLVSPLHGNKLSAKLQAAGVRHYVVYIPWATHAFDYTLNGPGGQISTWAVRHFLAECLK